eukprot:49651-Rhodomonas_salina.2
MSGTGIAYDVPSLRDVGYRPTGCALRCMVLRLCYALSGTELAYGGRRPMRAGWCPSVETTGR